MKKYNFSVLVEKDEDGVLIGRVPELIGCQTYGATMTELLANVKEAIEVCLVSYHKDGTPAFNPNYLETHRVEIEMVG